MKSVNKVILGSLFMPVFFGTAESTGAAAAKTWARYIRSWTLWNHVRKGAALAAAIALGLAAS